MKSNVFSEVNATDEILMEISVSQKEQAYQIADLTNNMLGIKEIIATMRAYNESMESRLKHEFMKGFENAVVAIREEVAKIGTGSKAKDVVKAIDKRSASEKRARKFEFIRRRMERVMAKYLIYDIPLTSYSKGSKNPTLTPQGQAVYEAISEFTEQLAEVSGRSKGYYTNPSRYKRFFRDYNIPNLTKTTINKTDGKVIKTVFATVIINGYVKQYIDFLLSLLEEEKSNESV